MPHTVSDDTGTEVEIYTVEGEPHFAVRVDKTDFASTQRVVLSGPVTEDVLTELRGGDTPDGGRLWTSAAIYDLIAEAVYETEWSDRLP